MNDNSERSPISESASAQPVASNSRRDWAVAVSMLIAACGFSGWLAYPNKFLPPPNAGLVVDEKDLDFGEAWEDRVFPWKFTIHNPTSKDATIAKFWNSCSCASVKPESLTISAGGKAVVIATLDLSVALPHQPATTDPTNSAPATRPFEADFIPQMGDLAFEQGWKVTGRVRQLLKVSRLVVDFGRHSEFVQPLIPQRVFVLSTVPLHCIEPVCTSRLFRVSAKPARSEEDNSDKFELDIAPVATLPTGQFSFGVKMTAILKNGQRITGGREITVQAEVAADIQASPPVLSFGARTQGDDCHDFITLYSLTNSQFQVIEVQSKGDGLGVKRVSATVQSAGPVFGVTQRVASTGAQIGEICFSVADKAGRSRQVRVPVHCHGIKKQ